MFKVPIWPVDQELNIMCKEKTLQELVKRRIEINREGYQIIEELTRHGVDKDGDPLY